jgi:hypothetical protein
VCSFVHFACQVIYFPYLHISCIAYHFLQWHRCLGHLSSSRLSIPLYIVQAARLANNYNFLILPMILCPKVLLILSILMYEVMLRSLPKGDNQIMLYLLVIIRDSLGIYHMSSCVSFFRLNDSLPIWCTLSLILPFVTFLLTLLMNTFQMCICVISLTRVLFLSSPTLVLMLRMVSLSVSIVTLWRQLVPFPFLLVSFLTSRSRLSLWLFSSLIDNHPLLLKALLPTNIFLILPFLVSTSVL